MPPQENNRLVRIPLAIPAVSLAAGSAAGVWLPAGFWAWVVAGALSLAGALAIARRNDLRLCAAALVGIGFFTAGAARMNLAWYAIHPGDVVTFAGACPIPSTLRGTVSSFPVAGGTAPGEKNLRFLFDPEQIMTIEGWTDTRGTARVTVRGRDGGIRPGQTLQLTGTLGRYRGPDNPGGYDPAARGRCTGVRTWFHVPTAAGATVIERARGLRRFLGRWRAAAAGSLLEPGGNGAMLADAMVTGERHPHLRELNELMQRAGIAHFLSISGMHLCIFLGFLYTLCRLFSLSPRSAAWAVLTAVGVYLLLAECRPPLLRSAVMAAAIAVGVISGRRGSSLNALCAAGIILLMIEPRQLLRPGFQMSFTIVAGIILFEPRINDLLFSRAKRTRKLMIVDSRGVRAWFRLTGVPGLETLCSISLTAYLAAAPLTAYWFGFISPWAAILSMALLPLVTAVLIPGYIALAIALPMPTIASGFAHLSADAASCLAWVVTGAEYLPGLCIELFPVSPAWVALCYAALVGCICARRRWLRVASIAALLGAVAWTHIPPRGAGGPEMNLLATGNGQCLVARGRRGETVVFDAGAQRYHGSYRRVLSPFLRARRLPAPSAVFISHADSDHYNMLPALLDRDSLDMLYAGEAFRIPDTRASGSFMRIEDRCTVSRLAAGDAVETGGFAVSVLWPPAGLVSENSNEQSLVLSVESNGHRVLLPGDIGGPIQRTLLEHPGKLTADVLVLPHHGEWSEVLPAFIAAVDPDIILASCGRHLQARNIGNRDAAVFFSRLQETRRCYTTARSGWIRLDLGGEEITVKTMR